MGDRGSILHDLACLYLPAGANTTACSNILRPLLLSALSDSHIHFSRRWYSSTFFLILVFFYLTISSLHTKSCRGHYLVTLASHR